MQRGLERIAKEHEGAGGTSWLEPWWDAAYLEDRGPAPINVNPFFIFNEAGLPSGQVLYWLAQRDGQHAFPLAVEKDVGCKEVAGSLMVARECGGVACDDLFRFHVP